MAESTSEVRKLAEAESARAEQEPDNGEQEAEQEAEETPDATPDETPEQEPEGALTVEQVADLERAQEQYLKRVERVLTPLPMPPVCTHCQGTGLDFGGGESPPDFQTHEQYRTCDSCGGLGQIRTGSRVHGHELLSCPACQGRGFLERLPQPAAVPDQQAAYGTPQWMGTAPPTPPAG